MMWMNLHVVVMIITFFWQQNPVTLHFNMFAGGKTCVTAEGDAELWRALPAQVEAVPSSLPESVWVPTAQLHNVLRLVEQ